MRRPRSWLEQNTQESLCSYQFTIVTKVMLVVWFYDISKPSFPTISVQSGTRETFHGKGPWFLGCSIPRDITYPTRVLMRKLTKEHFCYSSLTAINIPPSKRDCSPHSPCISLSNNPVYWKGASALHLLLLVLPRQRDKTILSVWWMKS